MVLGDDQRKTDPGLPLTRLEFAKIYGLAPDQLRMTVSMSVLSALMQGTNQDLVEMKHLQTAVNVSLNTADLYLKALSTLAPVRDPI